MSTPKKSTSNLIRAVSPKLPSEALESTEHASKEPFVVKPVPQPQPPAKPIEPPKPEPPQKAGK
jgi:hypothetical protein